MNKLNTIKEEEPENLIIPETLSPQEGKVKSLAIGGIMQMKKEVDENKPVAPMSKLKMKLGGGKLKISLKDKIMNSNLIGAKLKNLIDERTSEFALKMRDEKDETK